VPPDIKKTFERLGIPEAERKFLSGASAQYDSEVLYKSLRKNISELGVVFTDMDSAVKEYPELVKRYFMTRCVPAKDNKFSALHGAFWSGGSFVLVPAGVKVPQPLQIYFMMNYPGFGQMEHTLIVAEEGASVQYIEGCSAPHYTKDSLHSAVVEIFVGRRARVRYTSIQNWSKNVYNLNTKRSIVSEEGIMEWVGGTLGSGTTMLYPCSMLVGKGARAEHLSIALAGEGQVKDTGAKVLHMAPSTSSRVISKSICTGGGIARYRGLLTVGKGCTGVKANVRCDSIIVDSKSKAETIPRIDVRSADAVIGHEAAVGRISDDQLFYLMSRGLSENEAVSLIVRGFIEPIVKELPLEYAVEMNRLVEMEMEGSVG
jgi:Fe-S cluster assembly protein SufB